MKYVVDDLEFDTAELALIKGKFGVDVLIDHRGHAYATVWSEVDEENRPCGFIVGSIARNPSSFISTYTLTLDEHNNDRKRMLLVFESILNRKTMR